LDEGSLAPYEEVLFIVPVLQSMDKHMGCLPLDEVLGNVVKIPVG
jgi:hypothetical protein